MLNWGALDPARVERAVQQLLRAQHPGMVSIDGAGGDGGMDAQLRTADGLTVFEIKSFTTRLTNPRRRQIEKSLRKALESAPEMKRWVLVIPLNPTRAELAWFQGKLQEVAGADVELEWRGIDWLDGQATAAPAFRRYVEGPQSEVLKAAAELHVGQAVLENGAQDLFVRNRAIQEQVDSLSMHWTADWAVEGNIQTTRLRAKHPDAAIVDPIHIKPTFVFDPANEKALATQQQLENVINFGGDVKISEEFLKDLTIEASDEAKLLLRGMEGPGTLWLKGETETLDRPVRTTIEMAADNNAGPPVSLDVWIRTRTAGAKGITLHGSDPADAMSVVLRLPYPDETSNGAPGRGASFDVSFNNPWKFAPRDALPVLRLHAAFEQGGQLTLRVHGLVLAWTEVPPREPGDLDYPALVQIAEVVVRLEEKLGTQLRLPDNVSLTDLQMAEALVATFDQDLVETPFDTITASIESVEPFLAQFPEEQFALHSSHPEFRLTLGDLEVEFGPVAIWMPQVELSNRAELEANHNAEEPVARFKTIDQPAYFRSREFAAAIEHPAEPESD